MMRSGLRMVRDDRVIAGIILLSVLATQVIFLARAAVVAGVWGFPLDDAWIHQVFARNLAQTGLLAFNPGVPATGATAPLWTLILSIGYWLALDPRAWALILGVLCQSAMGLLVYKLVQGLLGESPSWLALVAALLTIGEWEIIWASLSGMETSFFIVLSLLLFYLNFRQAPWPVQGLVAGLLTITRPEGVFLFGLVLLSRARRVPISRLFGAILVWAVVVAPVLYFNWTVGGSPLPNTYTAKVAVLPPQPLAGITFLVEAGFNLLLGLNVLLIPFLLWFVQSERAEKRKLGLMLVWALGLIALYTVRLPNGYQHVRYMMPAIPYLTLVGVAGIRLLYQRQPAVAFLHLGLNTLTLLFMIAEGANAYAYDVQNINAQQVAIGQWIQTHTPSSAVIAADDIGGIGYYADRKMVDLAGLVTPEIVPYLHPGKTTVPFVCAQGVNYLAIFLHDHPDYPGGLVLQEVYRRHLDVNAISQAADLYVYEVQGGCPGSE